MTEQKIGTFKIIAKCSKTRARASEYKLHHGTVSLPTFMPVATRAAMKCVLSTQLDEEIILGNTYHCRNLKVDLHNFMNYKKCMLTDSGGFQIVSLEGAKVIEEGVIFPDLNNIECKNDDQDTKNETKHVANNSKTDTNKFDDKNFILLTPEKSINIQNILGADIIMQLDDVLNPMQPRDKIEDGMERSIRWLRRCYKAHKNENQILFPIIQGGLHFDLRRRSTEAIIQENPKGIAIGGLCGGEDKSDFSNIVSYCVRNLPENIPKYVMGIGYPEDVIVCIALGADMSDCVYPTRTARFGRAMTDEGDLNLMKAIYKNDHNAIEMGCECFVCERHTRSYIYSLKGTTNFCSLISLHNIYYMRNLTKRIRNSIIQDSFEQFICNYFEKRYKNEVPVWVKINL